MVQEVELENHIIDITVIKICISNTVVEFYHPENFSKKTLTEEE